MDVAGNRVLQRNMAKIKQSHEELAMDEFGNMEKWRDLLREKKKNGKRKRKN
jgi:hypothetical protein